MKRTDFNSTSGTSACWWPGLLEPGHEHAEVPLIEFKPVFFVLLRLGLRVGEEHQVVQAPVEMDYVPLPGAEPQLEVLDSKFRRATVLRDAMHVGPALEQVAHGQRVALGDGIANQQDAGQASNLHGWLVSMARLRSWNRRSRLSRRAESAREEPEEAEQVGADESHGVVTCPSPSQGSPGPARSDPPWGCRARARRGCGNSTRPTSR